MTSFNCNTCHVKCESIEEVKGHYKTELHIFNSKRRAKCLKPVSADEFAQLVLPANNKPANTSTSRSVPSSTPTKTGKMNPYTSLNHNALQRTFINNSDKTRQEQIASMSTVKPRISTENIPLSSNGKSVGLAISQDGCNDNDDEDVNDNVDENQKSFDEAYADKPIQQLPIAANISIFDNKQFDNVESCISHMVITNGFFIPDSEYISDLEGLLLYLGEKVKIGATCLYCQKRFSSGHACQHHMLQKSHCKLAYEENLDLDEYEDFYDFSSTFEDCSDDEEEDPGVAQFSPIGELILPDGRTLGHRDFRLYYKQQYRPEDDRPSVLAQKREELLKISTKYNDKEHSIEVIQHMSDIEIKSALVKHYKMIRKANIQEQRGMMRRLAMDQQREYKSKIAAARSSATTTAKIRDYHKSVL